MPVSLGGLAGYQGLMATAWPSQRPHMAKPWGLSKVGGDAGASARFVFGPGQTHGGALVNLNEVGGNPGARDRPRGSRQGASNDQKSTIYIKLL